MVASDDTGSFEPTGATPKELGGCGQEITLSTPSFGEGSRPQETCLAPARRSSKTGYRLKNSRPARRLSKRSHTFVTFVWRRVMPAVGGARRRLRGRSRTCVRPAEHHAAARRRDRRRRRINRCSRTHEDTAPSRRYGRDGPQWWVPVGVLGLRRDGARRDPDHLPAHAARRARTGTCVHRRAGTGGVVETRAR